MGRKRRVRTVEEELPEETTPETGDETASDQGITLEDVNEINLIDRFKEIGVDSGADVQVSFSRRMEAGGGSSYLDTVPLGEITSLEEYAKERWGGGRYSWRLKKAGRWASSEDFRNAVPIRGTFNVDGPAKAAAETKADEQDGWKSNLKDTLEIVNTMNNRGSGLGEMVAIMKSVADAASNSVAVVQKQAEQNIATILSVTQAQMTMMVETMKSQTAMLERSNADKIEMLRQQAEEKKDLMEALMEARTAGSKSIPERLVDAVTTIADRVVPPTQLQQRPALPPSQRPQQSVEQQATANPEDRSMAMLQNLFRIMSFCYENDSPPATCARNILTRYAGVDRSAIINYLRSKPLAETVNTAKAALQAGGFEIAEGLDVYATDVLTLVLKGAEGSGN